MSQHHFPSPDFDARWKMAIEAMHEHFVRLFYPSLSKKIDFSRGVRFLDKEYQKLFADWIKKGWTSGDKLLEYHLKDGKRQLILIHIEVHGGDDVTFKELQFARFYRIRDKHPDKKLAQITIYTGETVPPKPNEYRYSFEGTVIIHRFKAAIVKDMEEELLLKKAKTNPFAFALLASLEHIKTKSETERRRKTKIRLIRLCLESRFRELTEQLLIFVQFTIALPPEEEEIYRGEMEEILKLPDMKPYKELYPEATKSAELIFFGQTMDDRDEELAKKVTQEVTSEFILKMHTAGLKAEQIASIIGIDQQSVLKILEKNSAKTKKQKNGTKPKNGNGK